LLAVFISPGLAPEINISSVELDKIIFGPATRDLNFNKSLKFPANITCPFPRFEAEKLLEI
jgi:hypothetical protein